MSNAPQEQPEEEWPTKKLEAHMDKIGAKLNDAFPDGYPQEQWMEGHKHDWMEYPPKWWCKTCKSEYSTNIPSQYLPTSDDWKRDFREKFLHCQHQPCSQLKDVAAETIISFISTQLEAARREERERIKQKLDTMSFSPDQFNGQLTDKGKAQLDGWSKHYDAVLASLTNHNSPTQ